MAAEEARTRCQAFRRQPLGQAEGRLCVAWPVRCAAQSCVNCGSILCFLWEVRNSCSWWRAVPPCACSVDRTGRLRRSATASAACRCSTVLPGEQPAGSVCGVGEAAVALYCMPRRVACGARVAARGTGGARGAAVGQPRGACAPRKLLDRRLHCERGRRYSNFALPIKSARPLLFSRRNLACCFSL